MAVIGHSQSILLVVKARADIQEREISRKLLKGSLIIQYSMPTNLRIVPSTSSKAAVIVRKQNKTVLTYKVSSDITNQPAILHDKFKPVIEVTLIVS